MKCKASCKILIQAYYLTHSAIDEIVILHIMNWNDIRLQMLRNAYSIGHMLDVIDLKMSCAASCRMCNRCSAGRGIRGRLSREQLGIPGAQNRRVCWGGGTPYESLLGVIFLHYHADHF